jgi:hypothetical protein
MGFTPFFLVYGSEAMLPTDIEYGSPRLKDYNKRNNNATREDALDQVEEAEMWLCYILPGISKVSDATTIDTSVGATSMLVTWCHDETKTPRDVTNSRHHGKEHTSSQKC